MADQLPPLTRKSRPKGRASILAGEERTPQKAPGSTEPTPPVATDAVTFEFPSTQMVEDVPKAAPAPRRPQAVSDEKVQLGVKVSEELKGRARAAYKEAAYHEDVSTFHQFVSQALEAEIHRIELAYNNGERLQPRAENLRRGRPAL